MAKKTVSEYKDMKLEDLMKELSKFKAELSKMTWAKSMGKIGSTKELKKKIAKIMTEINSR
ncbi:MAG TPA: 50S ribosomal protein L29 [Candidatus Dojkabacteria bacterium]|nr:50S ribosomal protein L29 [Candidatus Dojkabacteria bacterium]HQF36595.1 50S ribosomal protein L29 [Candidatus Dojkabacteria bacterium]